MNNDFNMWDPRKNNDYNYIDQTIGEWFSLSGVGVLVYQYMGTYSQTSSGDLSLTGGNITSIEDSVWGENRDRQYDTTPKEIKIVYNLQDSDFNLQAYGIFVDNDTYFAELHLNDCLNKLGRKILSGDVLRMKNMRDDATLDEVPLDKFFVVTDVNRASTGWSPTWYPHILRIKFVAMPATSEYNDILNLPANSYDDASDGVIASDSTATIGSVISDYSNKMTLNDAVVAEADAEVPYRNFYTDHLYVIDNADLGNDYPWIFAGNGVPPNGATLTATGTTPPANPVEGDWFLYTANLRPILYKYVNNAWIEKEVDYRIKWQAVGSILGSFINNTNTTTINDNTFNEQQSIRTVVSPKASN